MTETYWIWYDDLKDIMENKKVFEPIAKMQKVFPITDRIEYTLTKISDDEYILSNEADFKIPPQISISETVANELVSKSSKDKWRGGKRNTKRAGKSTRRRRSGRRRSGRRRRTIR
jgi:hypothetical protein